MQKLLFTLLLALSFPFLSGAATVSDVELRIASLLSELQILQTELQNLKSGEAAVSVVEVQTSPSSTSFTTTLGKGSEGSDVTKLQQYLAKDPSLYPEAVISGYYGSLTEAAVKRFQQKHNIVFSGTPTTTGYGTVGPKTRAVLNTLLTTTSSTLLPAPSSTPTPLYTLNTPNRSPNLSITGDRVVFLPNGASLSGLATDDGVPGVPLAYFWKKASGPGSVTFSSLNTKDTIATFSSPGTYQITLTVSDGDLFATYTIAVLVKAAISTSTPLPPPAPVPPPVSTPTLSFSVTPSSSSITKGESTTLSWSTTNVSTCTAGEGWSGTKAVSGSVVFSPTQTTTYTLLCIGTEGDTIGKEITITVTEPLPPTPPPSTTPSLTFSANTTTLTQGQSTTLTWTSANTTSCTASGGWTGTKSLQGSSAKIPSTTTTYTLTCMNATNESVSKSVTVTVTTPSSPPPNQNGLEYNGRWFTYDGQTPYFVGQDLQQIVADPAVNYINVLDQLQIYRINKVRIWLDAYWKPDAYLHPWERVDGRYDLDSWNPSYWQKLKDFITAAAARGIVIEVSIFDVYPGRISWWADTSMRVVWNKDFNINGVFSTNGYGNFYPQFFDLSYAERSTSGKTIKDYQKALVDKTLQEIGSYSNVFFEIANEFPGTFSDVDCSPGTCMDQVYQWQQYWADYIRQQSPRLVTVHAHDSSGQQTDGVQYFWDRPSVDVLNFHFYSDDPNNISLLLHDAQLKGKVLTENESYRMEDGDISRMTREAWAFFLSGGYYGLYQDDVNLVGSSQWLPFAKRLKALRDIAETARFAELSPVDSGGNEYDSLVSQGPSNDWQVMANPGSTYIAYFWGTKSNTSAKINLATGNYSYTWYDARDAVVLGSGSVSGGGTMSIPAPSSAWNDTTGLVLVVKK